VTAVPARAPDRESLFLRIGDWVPAAMGRPANIIVWMIAAPPGRPPSRSAGRIASGTWLAAWFTSQGAGPGCRAPGLGLERYGEEELMLRRGSEGGGVREDGRRARIMAAVADHDSVATASQLAERLCRFAVDEMALSGCALVLMAGADSASLLAGAGPHAQTITGL
jgi:hypothetical protein